MDYEYIKKHTKIMDLDKLIQDDLKTDEDIKDWLTIGLEEYLNDGDIKAFVSVLKDAIKAKDSISNISKKTGISRSNLYGILKGEITPQLDTILKLFKVLGYSLKVA